MAFDLTSIVSIAIGGCYATHTHTLNPPSTSYILEIIVPKFAIYTTCAALIRHCSHQKHYKYVLCRIVHILSIATKRVHTYEIIRSVVATTLTLPPQPSMRCLAEPVLIFIKAIYKLFIDAQEYILHAACNEICHIKIHTVS